MMPRRTLLARAASLGVLALLAPFAPFAPSAIGCSRAASPEPEVYIATAASMRVVMPALLKAFEAKRGGVKVRPSYGSSGELRKQVEGGAPIDGVIFASAKPVDDLIAGGQVDAGTRKVIATNTLVLIGPKNARPLTFATLAEVPPGEKLAIGDPGAVPAGQYARDVLQKKGAWDALQGRIVLGSDVAAVLSYARRGEVAAAIVYKTDIRGVADVVLLDEAKGDWAPRAEVVIGIVKGSKNEAAARSFFDFLASDEARAILSTHGFGPP
jgi:molybdate transport system substrate-binding protein